MWGWQELSKWRVPGKQIHTHRPTASLSFWQNLSVWANPESRIWPFPDTVSENGSQVLGAGYLSEHSLSYNLSLLWPYVAPVICWTAGPCTCRSSWKKIFMKERKNSSLDLQGLQGNKGRCSSRRLNGRKTRGDFHCYVLWWKATLPFSFMHSERDIESYCTSTGC